MTTLRLIPFALLAAAPAAVAEFPRQSAPEGAAVYFVAPEDGAVVSSPVRVVFGLRGMGVAPAGTQAPDTGHHHLLVGRPHVAMDAPLPASDQVLHFGGGQTETVLELPPGPHALQLVLGDYAHIPHDPPVASGTIVITVR